MSASKEELRLRAEAKKKELESRLAEMKADATAAKDDAVKDTQDRLDAIRDAASEGWDNLTDDAAEKINRLLAD